MTAYAVAHLRPAARLDDEVFEYMERIQSTFAPYGGAFLVHGTTPEVLEGEWPGGLVVLGFPTLRDARDWYESEAYQEIAPLRTRHLAGDVILVDGVAPGYDASLTAARMREVQEA
ncbi:DUF1330 domain-containing protein [Streptomyces xantholiticus]|uniref:DUF1330 domain-containing protein n=1 Tax=Streptomyces xantholiticus TaxID=68285 RepID=UPI00167A9E6F|nr:DUF1330 domain-containing protein [Streptomyces xantholiticus]GGW70489.1 hypothetical protein GCM10010381_64000 [Streptomyces xantholiticus]